MQEVLRVEGIVKSFPGLIAVNDVSFKLEKGSVLALMGENGAGKSTITKIICGAQKQDTGTIYLENKPVEFSSSIDAMNLGIAMVYQELTMVGDMSVAENIFMNRQPVSKFGNVNWKKLYDDTEILLKKFNLTINPKEQVKMLSVGTQQLLEILKAISLNPKVIILDEPTSSLTETEVKLLFNTIKILKEEGTAFIYITHKMSEIFEIADNVMIMRDGKYIAKKAISEVTESEIVKMMVGREIKDLYGSERKEIDLNQKYLFEVNNLTAHGLYDDISFGVRHGEIVGFAGLIGAGRTEMALGIMGAHKIDKGTVSINGKQVKNKSPKDAIDNKIGYLTEDRKKVGLYLDFPLVDNFISIMLKNFSTNGFMNGNKIKENAAKQIKKYSVATPSANVKMQNLSGGNQQKCLISMNLEVNPDVMIFDEPTRGVDIGAKSEIYNIIKDYAASGKGVVLISSELPELMGLSNRIIVMHNGKISGEVLKKDFAEDLIMEYATGIKKEI